MKKKGFVELFRDLKPPIEASDFTINEGMKLEMWVREGGRSEGVIEGFIIDCED